MNHTVAILFLSIFLTGVMMRPVYAQQIPSTTPTAHQKTPTPYTTPTLSCGTCHGATVTVRTRTLPATRTISPTYEVRPSVTAQSTSRPGMSGGFLQRKFFLMGKAFRELSSQKIR